MMRPNVFHGTYSITCANSVLPMFMLHPKFSKLGMIANVQPKIQIVDTHLLPGNIINIDVAVGAAQFNRTLVMPINY